MNIVDEPILSLRLLMRMISRARTRTGRRGGSGVGGRVGGARSTVVTSRERPSGAAGKPPVVELAKTEKGKIEETDKKRRGSRDTTRDRGSPRLTVRRRTLL